MSVRNGDGANGPKFTEKKGQVRELMLQEQVELANAAPQLIVPPGYPTVLSLDIVTAEGFHSTRPNWRSRYVNTLY